MAGQPGGARRRRQAAGRRAGNRHPRRQPGAGRDRYRERNRPRPAPPRTGAPDGEKGPSAADRLDLARGLFTRKRYGEALGVFDSLLAAIGDGGEAEGVPVRTVRREADRCRRDVDRNREQLEQIRRRIQGGGDARALAHRSAVCRFRLGQYAEALDDLEAAAAAAAAASGGGGAARYAADMLAGDCLSALRRHAEAEDAYLHALDDGGIPAGKCEQIGNVLAAGGRHAGAESAYARAAEKGADVHRKLDNCRARMGRTDFAPGGPAGGGERASMAIAAGRIMNQAMRLDKDRRYDDAVPLYIEAFRADPCMPDGFADRMEGLASGAGPAAGPAAGEAPHSASKMPDGVVFVVDSNVCIKAMIMHALGRSRSRSVPRRWAELAGVAASFEKNIRSGAYALTSKVYHETRSLLYSTRGIGDLLLDHSREVEICRAAAGKLDKLWAARGTSARPNSGLIDEAKRAMWAGWLAADSGTKDEWRSRKEVPEKPYKGGCSGEWADAAILASAIMILRGAGAPGGAGARRPGSVALLTKDSDFTMFAGGITAESKVRIVGKFA